MTTITPDLERMARAMCEADGSKWDAASFCETANGAEPEDQREYWRHKARAALESLMELSEGAQKAGAAAESWMADDSEGLTVWQAINRYIREGK